MRRKRQNIPTEASETTPLKRRGPGRPPKEIDVGVALHMFRNSASVRAVGEHLGCHRDTLYTRYRSIIDGGRKFHRNFWRDNIDRWMKEKRDAHQAEILLRRRRCGYKTKRGTPCRLIINFGGPCKKHRV